MKKKKVKKWRSFNILTITVATELWTLLNENIFCKLLTAEMLHMMYCYN